MTKSVYLTTRNLLFSFLFSVAGLSPALAQTDPAPDTADFPYWVEMMRDPDANFFETQKAFNTYWEGREYTKGYGYKAFKRWEHFMQQRVGPDGRKPAPGHVMAEYQSMNLRSNSGNWHPLGPQFNQFTAVGKIPGVGRLNAVAFHPTDTNIMYTGSPSGGFWRSADHGASWTILTDQLPTLGVSAIGVHPVDPTILYIGTGDRDANDAPGMGVWKSTDEGQTFVQSATGMGDVTVNKLLIHPDEPEILLAATEDGVFRSEDDGASWTLTSFPVEFKDLDFKPNDPDIVYAFGASRFYRSEDNGVTWTAITNGIPISTRMVLAVSPDQPDWVYVCAANTFDFKGMYRSTDGGLNFNLMSDAPNILGWDVEGDGDGGQAWYDLDMTVDPTDANKVYVGGIHIFGSEDGGQTWNIVSHNKIHVDQHALEYSPTGSLYIANDGGLYKSVDGVNTFSNISIGLVIGQIYRIGQSALEVDRTLSGYQDNGTMEWNGVAWDGIRGSDGMECQVDYTDPNYLYSTIQYGRVSRRTGNSGWANLTRDLGEEGAWVSPFTLGTADPNKIFIGYNNIWRAENVRAGLDDIIWTNISDGALGGNTTDFNRLENAPADPQLLYATKGNSLWRTNNALDSTVVWDNLTANTPASSNNIVDIQSDPTNPDVVMMTKTNHLIYRSTDRGLTWVDMTGSLPDVNLNTICFDSSAAGGIYLGTDLGVFYRDDTSGDWINFNSGFSLAVEVTELEIYYGSSPSEHRLRAATYGRGLWESDLFGNATSNFSVYATVWREEENKPVYGPFDVKFAFYRNLQQADVTGFEMNDLVMVNGSPVNLVGGPAEYSVTINPNNPGTIEISIADAAAIDGNGVASLESTVYQVEYIANTPAPLGNTGPGGVGDQQSLGIWLLPDSGLLQEPGGAPAVLPGDPVGAWMDQSGNGLMAEQLDATRKPTLTNDWSGFAGYAGVNFDSTNQELMVINGLAPGHNPTVFTVAQSNSELFNVSGWMGSSRMPNGYIVHNTGNSKNYYAHVRDADDTGQSSSRLRRSNIMEPHIYGLGYTGVGTYKNFIAFMDGEDRFQVEYGNDFDQRSDTQLVDVRLGYDFRDRYGFGKIGEHIVYNQQLGQSHRIIVKNYLAAKYDVELHAQQRYVRDTTYAWQVAGIGRESEYDLHTDAKGVGMLRMRDPSNLDDQEYQLWGHNNADLDTWIPFAGMNGISRVNRAYQVTETGDVGTVKLSIPADALPASQEELGLMISNDPTFAGVPLGVVFTLNSNGDSLEAEVDFPGNSYFTFISGSLEAIGGLTTVDEFDAATPDWTVYPNPSRGAFFVNVSADQLAPNTQVVLYNSLGQPVQQQTFVGQGDQILHFTGLAAGMYVVRLEGGETSPAKTVIVH